FAPNDLEAAALILGDEVRGTTAEGRPALDLPAAVRGGLFRAGVEIAREVDRCTACDDGWFSHRAGTGRGRQALAVWRDEAP
ncbi:MAG TPA: laccase domain-containing protein, partial [Acidimicrobiales bacterium]|nr:laccase domain-containing protein [Acidimicrobiales bacterium]